LNVSNTDFEFTDPAMAYDAIGWQMLYAVNITLLNYPDKPAPEGHAARPGGGDRLPARVARRQDVHLHGSQRVQVQRRLARHRRSVQARDRARGRSAAGIARDRVSARRRRRDARNQSKAGSVTGVTANGQTLVIKLVRANPTFLAELAMPFFGAVKPSMAIDPQGSRSSRRAGPYRIVSRTIGQSLTLARNPNYKGSRRRTPTGSSTPSTQTRTRVCSRSAPARPTTTRRASPPTAHADLGQQYGVKKGGAGRYFVNSYMGVGYVALNTSRAPFNRVNIRKAANFAIDRPAMVRVSGKFYGKRTDQILPPSLQGYREATLYPIKGADPAQARQLSGGAGNTVTIIHSTTGPADGAGQVLKFNLEQMGLKAETRPLPFAVALRTVGTRGADFDAYVGAGWPTIPTRSTSSTSCWTAATSRSRTTTTTRTSTTPASTSR
jgi:peptide/nickel transport system substrate-binding protein